MWDLGAILIRFGNLEYSISTSLSCKKGQEIKDFDWEMLSNELKLIFLEA